MVGIMNFLEFRAGIWRGFNAGGELQRFLTGDCSGRCSDLLGYFAALPLPQLSSLTTTLLKIYLTVTIIWFSVGATTWTVHVASGFPASAIAIPVTKLHVTAVSLWPGKIRFLNFRIIPVSSWHWPVVISGTGIGVLSVWIISGGRSVVPWIPGIIIPTGVAVKDIIIMSRVVTMKSWLSQEAQTM